MRLEENKQLFNWVKTGDQAMINRALSTLSSSGQILDWTGYEAAFNWLFDNDKIQAADTLNVVLFRLFNLKELLLSTKGLIEFAPYLDVLQNLEHLYLSSMRLYRLPDSIKELRGLKSISIFNKGYQYFPNWLSEMEGLEKLVVRGAQVIHLPKDIGRLQHLKKLYFHNTRMSIRNFPKSIADAKNTEMMYAWVNWKIRENTEPLAVNYDRIEIDDKYNRTYLTRYFEDEKEKGLDYLDLPESVCSLKNLEILSLTGQKIQHLPKDIGNLKELIKLELPINQLTSLPKSIGQLRKLKILSTAANPLKVFSKELLLLTNLVELNIGTILMKSIPQEFCSFQNLRKLRINKEALIDSETQIEWLKENIPNCEIGIDGNAKSIEASWLQLIKYRLKTLGKPLNQKKVCSMCKQKGSMRIMSRFINEKKTKGLLDSNVRSHVYFCTSCGNEEGA